MIPKSHSLVTLLPERQAADYRERLLENRIRQAETELAFRTPGPLRGWFAAWCDSVPKTI